MPAAEVTVVWRIDEHQFVMTASLADGALTLRLAMPVAFLAEAAPEQRQQYGQQRDAALLELAAVLAQHKGESIHHTHH